VSFKFTLLLLGVALGDLQSSVFALLKEPTDAVLNISTSAQLAFVRPTFSPETNDELRKALQIYYIGTIIFK
jgi:hypothetical protein